MKQIYCEVGKKFMEYYSGIPCIKVTVYVPDKNDDQDLPSIIVVGRGKTNELGGLDTTETQYYTEQSDYQPLLIRKAIAIFDRELELLRDKGKSETGRDNA